MLSVARRFQLIPYRLVPDLALSEIRRREYCGSGRLRRFGVLGRKPVIIGLAVKTFHSEK
jgi:hypothetical protein